MSDVETLSPILPDPLERRVATLLQQVCRQHLSIATAESCTGGLLASLLTDVEGCGHAFERGFVVYSPEAKCELLHVAADDLAHCGAVSREVAIAMARGAIKASAADIAVSVTGFAGPAGPGEEEGLVHFACARRDGDVAHREAHFGAIGRGPVRLACLDVALGLIEEAATKPHPTG